MFQRFGRQFRAAAALTLVSGLAIGLVPAPAESYEIKTSLDTDTSAVDAWWPADGVTVTGTQPFKAVVSNRVLTDYKMYWQVDGGTRNLMRDSYVDWPHKQSDVNVTGWNWRGSGPYEIKFTALDHSGAVIGSKAVKIRIGAAATTTTTATTDTKTVTASATGTSTATVTASATETSATPSTSSTTTTTTETSGDAGLGAFFVEPNGDIQNQANAWRTSRPDDARKLDEMAKSSIARWFGGWNGDIRSDVDALSTAAAAAGKTPVMVAYNIPQRDCGGHSAGGTSDYKAWIRAFAAGLEGRTAVVILEPDSLAMISCLSAADLANRKALLADATSVLKAQGAKVYLDAGHSSWVSIADMAERLRGSGIDKADGFALNVSNFRTTSDNNAYGRQLSAQVGGKKFVIDTSRNGNGPSPDAAWCNPSGRASGERPTAQTGEPLADAYLWIKYPGQSDGACNGGPAAGQWWGEYALGLSQRAAW